MRLAARAGPGRSPAGAVWAAGLRVRRPPSRYKLGRVTQGPNRWCWARPGRGAWIDDWPRASVAQAVGPTGAGP